MVNRPRVRPALLLVGAVVFGAALFFDGGGAVMPTSTQAQSAAGPISNRLNYVQLLHGGFFLTGQDTSMALEALMSTLDKVPWLKVVLEYEGYAFERLADEDPYILDRLRRYIAAGRIEVVGGTYTQPFVWPTGGESLIRQFQVGRELAASLLGAQVVSYAVNELGLTSQLPQLFQQLGIRYVFLKNTWYAWCEPVGRVNQAKLWWIGPDGARVEAVPRYAAVDDTAAIPSDEEHLRQFYELASRAGISDPVILSVPDLTRDFPWDPVPQPYIISNHFAQLPPWLRSVTVREYFENSAPPDRQYRFTQDELIQLHYPWGWFGGTNEIRSHEAERALLLAEELAAFAALTEAVVFPHQEFESAWKELFLAEHHDAWILAPLEAKFSLGSWHEWTAQRLENVAKAAASLEERALSALVGRIDTLPPPGLAAAPSTPIVVFNPTGRTRSAWVRLEPNAEPMTLQKASTGISVLDCEGRKAPSGVDSNGTLGWWAEDVPAFGYKVFHVVGSQAQGAGGDFTEPALTRGESAGSAPRGHKPVEVVLENEFYRVRINGAGGPMITSIYDKELHAELLASGVTLQAFIPELGRRVTSSQVGEFLGFEKNGTSTVNWRGRFYNWPVDLTVTLLPKTKRIDLDLSIDFGEKALVGAQTGRESPGYASAATMDADKLRIVFPLAVSDGTVVRDAPFDVAKVRRPYEDSGFLALSWADLSDETKGITVLGRGPQQYVADRRAGILSVVLAYGGPYLYAPEGVPLAGRHEYHFSLFSHSGGWQQGRVPEVVDDALHPFIVVATDAHAGLLPAKGSFLAITPVIHDGESIASLADQPAGGESPPWRPLVSSVSMGLGGEILVRLFNPYPSPLTVTVSVPGRPDLIPTVVDLTGKEMTPAGGGGVYLGSAAIRTVRLKASG